MSLIVHAWWGDRFQTLCNCKGPNKVANLVRYTSIPVNCPQCLGILNAYGYDESKHELMPDEITIRRISSAIYPTITEPAAKPELLQELEELTKEDAPEEIKAIDKQQEKEQQEAAIKEILARTSKKTNTTKNTSKTKKNK